MKNTIGGRTAASLLLATLLSSFAAWGDAAVGEVATPATPQFMPAGGTYRVVQNVAISDSTSGAQIYYTTDGSTPSKTSTPYVGAITVGSTETLKAIAVANGLSRSAVAKATYVIELPTPAPTFTPGAGAYTSPQNVSIMDTLASATIYYTTNGTVPGLSSPVYTGPITIGSTETLKAIAIVNGGSRSTVTSALYRITLATVATPVIAPPAGSYSTPQQVSIGDTTSGATIYYTTDGTTPTINSPIYAGTFPVSSTETVEAIAMASGDAPSATASAAYVITPSGIVESITYAFGGNLDAKTPMGGLILGADGNLYGTSYQGGSNALGTVFSVTPAGVESVLYSFTGGVQGSLDGKQPFAALLQASDGNFYGTTELGGAHGAGTVFQVTPAGMEAVLYSFGVSADGNPDGSFPEAGLIQGNDGNFYGTTASGGANQAGTVFKITPTGQESVLYSFAGSGNSLDGASPRAALLQGTDGNFYGTTLSGGINNLGTVFEITPDGVESVLYSFAGGSSDGEAPVAALTQGVDGNFYGATAYGGANDAGTAFELSPSGAETLLYSFGATPADGAYPLASLIQGSDGNFYGTTAEGNSGGTGTLFQLTPSGSETVLYSFAPGSGSTDGANPHGALLQAGPGSFYGTTENGGANNAGTVFQLTIAGSDSHRKRVRSLNEASH